MTARQNDLGCHQRYKDLLAEKKLTDDMLAKLQAAFTAMAADHAKMKVKLGRIQEVLT